MMFIPLAESTGLILQIGRWVLVTACAQLDAWSEQPKMSALSIAVNVSARQFYQQDFVEQVLSILEQTGANQKRLKLELTETLLVSNIEDVIAKMHKLKAICVGFSLDDFGTGYSSLSYLKRLPLDQLKIVQSARQSLLDWAAAHWRKPLAQYQRPWMQMKANRCCRICTASFCAHCRALKSVRRYAAWPPESCCAPAS
jgi:EAL domain-containing protein (putative c-di-GMP-specific phosphodiesterase class I)